MLLELLQHVNVLFVFVRRLSRSNLTQQHHLVAKRTHICLTIQKWTLA